MPHAVARLRTARLARSAKPFLARGGSRVERCAGCRVALSHCLCTLRPPVAARAGVCLLMADIEPLKPSNTGWLIADVVADTFAFGWARTTVDPALLALLADPRWQPVLVFPGEFVAPERVVTGVAPALSPALDTTGGTTGTAPTPAPASKGSAAPAGEGASAAAPARRPLFVLLDATWPEARKMFRKSPYLDALPVLSLQPGELSRYQLRRSRRGDHWCTSEVAALCLALAGDLLAAHTLQTYLDVFTHHYLQAKNQLPVDWQSAAHLRLQALRGGPGAPL
ncbi:MAG: DTW domain-containing protein [Simplicispira sp.]|nr:DTW domain-containing protein [Simplicispira sp.]